MTEDEIIRTNMLIHGHDTDIKILEISEKLIDLAVMLATNEDYEKTDYEATFVQPKLILKDSRIFLREKFVLHQVPYADEVMLKLKLHGKLIKGEKDLLKLYNKVGVNMDPFEIPVKFVREPYYYGNVSLLTNLSDDEEFLKNMKLYFKSIDLGHRTCSMSSVCYVHEIIHTQLESLKGIVRDYYNGEVLSIFMELLYAEEKSPTLYRETLKNRINMFLTEYHSLFNYLNCETVMVDGKWYNVISCKYIVSTLKAFNLYSKYIREDEIGKANIIYLVQKVISGVYSLEDMLEELNITYDNSLEPEHIATLIYR